jgi:hypothetical protein
MGAGKARRSLPNRLAEINLGRRCRGPDPRAGNRTDCRTSQRGAEQRATNDTRCAANRRAAARTITG